jgi:predicted AlkP superfamily pyrophosphatase or phosphodiesterase
MRRSLPVGLILALAFTACRVPGVRVPRATPGPRVLITIVVDQMAAWMAAERWPQLPADGGFARLRREGLTAELRYAHAATDTAPGHAALYTGAVPRTSGIVANETLGPDDEPRAILLDERTRLVDVAGAMVDRPGSSLARLRVETLADVLETQAPGAPVYSFSLKDRGALPGAGRRPRVALWLDVTAGAFVTSTAFPTPPPWAAALADGAAVSTARAGGWSLDAADGRFVAEHAETADDQAGEGDLGGLGRVFPHAVPSAKAMRATPIGDRVLFALARAALDEIRAGTRRPPALLALSLSSNDYVEHVFGPQSWEAWAELLELDRRLATLLTDADRAVGPDGYAVLLTSDHGGGALPEVAPEIAGVACRTPGATEDAPAADRWERPCEPRRRLAPTKIVTRLEEALDAELGPGPWVRGFAEPLIYLTPRGRGLAGAERARLVRAARTLLLPLGVRDVEDTQLQPKRCADDETLAALTCRAIDPAGPGDLYLVVAPGAFFDPGVVPGFGASHGSPYLYDRAVPLLVRAPGRVPAGAVREAPVAFTAFARTAASLLGVRPPAAARGGEDLAAPPGRAP